MEKHRNDFTGPTIVGRYVEHSPSLGGYGCGVSLPIPMASRPVTPMLHRSVMPAGDAPARHSVKLRVPWRLILSISTDIDRLLC